MVPEKYNYIHNSNVFVDAKVRAILLLKLNMEILSFKYFIFASGINILLFNRKRKILYGLFRRGYFIIIIIGKTINNYTNFSFVSREGFIICA